LKGVGYVELPKIKKTTLVDSIVEIIINKINNNEFKTGEVLPSEIEMSKQFGVSRATVREAVSYLIGMGVLERTENGLEIVQSIPSQFLRNLNSIIDVGFETQSLYETRIFFEIGFAYLASLKANEEDIKKLDQLNLDIINNLDNAETYWKTDLEFHYEIARIADNEFLFSLYKMIMKLFTNYLENNNKNIFKQRKVVQETPIYHEKLIEALKAENSVDAINVTIQSLQKAMSDMINRKIKQAMSNNTQTSE